MSLTAAIALMKRIDLFARLDAVRLEVLAFTAERRCFEAGETVFEAGAPADAAYLILDGEAVMFAHIGEAREGGEPRALRLDRGDLIGETALFESGVRWSTVRAATRLDTLRISRDVFDRLLGEFPEMAGAASGALADRLQALGDELAELRRRFGGR